MIKKVLISLLMLLTINVFGEGNSPHGINWIELAGSVFNFVVLFGGIIYFAKKTVKEMLKKRKETIENEIKESQKQKDEISTKLSLLQAKLDNIDNEIKDIKKYYDEITTAQIKETEERTKKDTERLEKTFQMQMDSYVDDVKQNIKSLTIEKAIEEAQKIINERISSNETTNLNLINSFKIIENKKTDLTKK